MKHAKISVIVPVYNVPEEYLRKCIESIQVQTLEDIEIILVDDGSPDKCGKICDSYASNDKRINVIHKSNGGLSSARNAGFQAASCEWVMFVDGDDWIEPIICERLYIYGKEYEVQLVMCGLFRDYTHSSIPYKFYLDDKRKYVGKECEWLQEQVLHYNGNIATAYCKLINREFLLDSNIMHNEALRQGAEGAEFSLRLFGKVQSVFFTSEPYYHYIYNESSMSSFQNETDHAYVIKSYEQIKEIIQKSSNKNALMPWLYNRLLYVVITVGISGYFHPSNHEPYSEKKRKYSLFLQQPIIEEALQNPNYEGLSKERRLILFIIKWRMYGLLKPLGYMRKWQKTHVRNTEKVGFRRWKR